MRWDVLVLNKLDRGPMFSHSFFEVKWWYRSSRNKHVGYIILASQTCAEHLAAVVSHFPDDFTVFIFNHLHDAGRDEVLVKESRLKAVCDKAVMVALFARESQNRRQLDKHVWYNVVEVIKRRVFNFFMFETNFVEGFIVHDNVVVCKIYERARSEHRVVNFKRVALNVFCRWEYDVRLDNSVSIFFSQELENST